MRPKNVVTPLLAVIACAAFAQNEAPQSILFRRELKENVQTDYKLELNMQQKISSEMLGGEQDFGIVGSMKYVEKTGKLDTGKQLLDIEVIISNMKFEYTGFAVMLQGMMDQMPREMKTSMRVNNRYAMVPLEPKKDEAEAAPKPQQGNLILNMVGTTWTEALQFPEKEVKVGDVWDTVLPKSPSLGNKEVTLKSKFKEMKQIGDANCAVIVTEGILPLVVDLSSMAGGMGGQVSGATLSGPLNFKMEVCVDPATGKIVEMVASTRGKQVLEVNQMTMDVDNNTVIKLKPWKASENKTNNN